MAYKQRETWRGVGAGGLPAMKDGGEALPVLPPTEFVVVFYFYLLFIYLFFFVTLFA